ncbi:MAG: hypothetical protein CBE24_03055 [bacterium TMED264]|nr:MAG: hypothetical protein CBE24_03055 [bacterium TMED264]
MLRYRVVVPEIINVFSYIWWFGIIFSIIISILIVQLAIRIPPDLRKVLMVFLGVFLLSLELVRHYHLYDLGRWSVSASLPIHLCGISRILAGIILIKPNKIGFQFLALIGSPGALHALLTPQLNHGRTDFMIFEYYASHTGIILTPIIFAIVLGYRIQDKAWIQVFIMLQFLLVFIGLSNYILNANYMYLAERPLVRNPMIIGYWPWYILGFELLGFIHIYIFFKLYKLFKPLPY